MFLLKSQRIVFLLTLITLSIFSISSAQAVDYKNVGLGLSFSYPDSIHLDMSNPDKDPYNIPFTYGKPPYSLSILLKDTGSVGNISTFLKTEHARQKAGGYAGEVQEKHYKLSSGHKAVELIRTTSHGTIYYFVFPTLKTKKIMGLWLMSSPAADPRGNAVTAYKAMRDSLALLR